jgi:hypothetical protein
VQTTVGQCVMYSGTNSGNLNNLMQQGTPVSPEVAAGIPACQQCASQTVPCPALPACVSYGCVTSGTSGCVASCGVAGVQVTQRTCVAYSGGNTQGVPVTTSNLGTIGACAGCTSTSTPCPAVPACVTYGCVTSGTSSCVATCGVAGVQVITRTCVAYSGTNAQGVPVTTSNLGTIGACAGCTSTSTPCPAVPACEN